MKSFHERLAELHMKPNRTAEEMMEFHVCLLRNTEYVHSMLKLNNHSLAASMVGDTGYHHDICAKIDELERDPHSTKVSELI